MVLFPLVLHFVGSRTAHGRQPGVVHKLHVPLFLAKGLVMPRPSKHGLTYGARPSHRGDPILSVPCLFGKGERFVPRVLVSSQKVLLAPAKSSPPAGARVSRGRSTRVALGPQVASLSSVSLANKSKRRCAGKISSLRCITADRRAHGRGGGWRTVSPSHAAGNDSVPDTGYGLMQADMCVP